MTLNPHQIDTELVRLSDLLEERTEDYARAANAAARAEARYKRSYAEAMLLVIGEGGGRKTTVQEREARVDLAVADDYEARLITDATARSVRASLAAITTQIEAARTIGATLRQLTGPR